MPRKRLTIEQIAFALRQAEGSLYVAAVIDLFSRRVVGWSMQASVTAQLVAFHEARLTGTP